MKGPRDRSCWPQRLRTAERQVETMILSILFMMPLRLRELKNKKMVELRLKLRESDFKAHILLKRMINLNLMILKLMFLT